MKQKELKNLAKKIAKAESDRYHAKTEEEVKAAEEEIYRLSGKVSSLEDIVLIDEYVQEILDF